MNIFEYPRDKELIRDKLSGRKKLYDRGIIDSVSKIFRQVETDRDKAIIELTEKFDNTRIREIELRGTYIDKAVKNIPESLRKAILHAKENIEEVNRFLLPDKITTAEIRPGTIIGEKHTPLESVGLWVPARKGTLISTALMLIGSAKTAGVKNIYVGMAPTPEGIADKATVAACKIAGADKIFVGNGVGIIAGFSIATESIPEVDGIFGPGPGGIAAAMALAFSYGKKTVLGIGPTDAAVICDESADPDMLAYDLINEAEHGPDSSSILATTSIETAKRTGEKLKEIIDSFPDEFRKANLNKVFGGEGYGAIIHAPSINEAIDVVNDYAPEHMIIKCDDGNKKIVLDNIKNAGEILIGDYAPFSAGNYAIGITAVLPTNGFAKNISGISAKDMIKTSTIGQLDKQALEKLLPTISELGKWEGLPAHVLAAEKRFMGRG